MNKKKKSNIRYMSYPRTEPSESYLPSIVNCFRKVESKISTVTKSKGLTSNEVLAITRPDLEKLGFEIEAGKSKSEKIERPVFYGENGIAELKYQIDGYHDLWRCGIEVEAGRAWMGNAIYRDLIQAMVMVNVDHLVLAIPNTYKYKTSGRNVENKDYDNTSAVAEALYGHTRVKMPYKLTLIGY